MMMKSYSILGILIPALLLIGMMSPPSLAGQTGIERLDAYYARVQSFHAGFQQVVMDENMAPLEESSGNVLIRRPDKFRWDYAVPNEQLIVGDGKDVWIYDIDLEQVTVRRLKSAIGETPAALLAGGGDLKKDFTLSDVGNIVEIHWIELTPKDKESNFKLMRMGFDGDDLRLMELLDQLDQTTRIIFSNIIENSDIDNEKFHFTPPIGVDVIDDR